MADNIPRPGRPKLTVDMDLVGSLRDKGLGWRRVTDEYMKTTGQYCSKRTIKRRADMHVRADKNNR